MNEEPRDLERRLEQATAPHCPAEALTDPEVAAWREGWLALGKLLESVESPPDTRFACRVPAAKNPPRPRKNFPLSALIAASLLVALALFGLFQRSGAVRGPALAQGPSAQVPLPQNPDAETDLRWDDNWDEKLSALSTRLVLAQNEGDGWTADYYNLRSRASALKRELENITL